MSAAEEVITADTKRMLAEFRRDFLFYAPRALHIRAKSGAVVPFMPNRAQLYVHQQIETQKRNTGKVRALVLKGRQQGVSTLIEGRYYWLTSGTPGIQAYIVTHEDAATANLFGMAERYHEHCPEELRPHTGASNSKELRFDVLDSGYKVATAGTRNVGRSSTIQLLHGSETAFWPHAEEHLAGLGQTIPNAPGTEIILESTANGPSGAFWSMWQDAERGQSEYIPIFVPWFWQPEYRANDTLLELSSDDLEYQRIYGLDSQQMAWRQQKIRDDFRGDRSLFDQEYPADSVLAFLRISGLTLIPALHVSRAQTTETEARGPKIIGVDPAEYGDDDTAVIKRQGRRAFDLVRWNGVAPMDTVGRIAVMADQWGGVDAINVDATGLGSGIADRLRELGYPVNRIMVGESAIRDDLYQRRGDELWGDMRDWLADQPCQIPPDPVLQGDLTTRTFDYDSSRRIKLTSKEKLKRDGKKSPDAGDALAMTFGAHFAPGYGLRKLDHKRRSRGKVI